MKVLMTADTVGGVWTYAIELARALAPHGVEVCLATMGRPTSPAQRQEALKVPGLEVFESTYKLEWMDEPWRDVHESGRWLLELEHTTAPDIVHLNGYAHGRLPFRAPTIVVAHSCVVSWWEAVKNEPAPRQYHRYRIEVSAGISAADLVVAPTQAMLSALLKHYTPPRSTLVISNSRDPSLFRAAEKQPYVFSAGRVWDEAKNIATLDRIANRLQWTTFVAGDDRHPGGSGTSVQHVQMLGQLGPRDVASWLAKASIYALPARYEPFGLSALEAALSGCALVLGDIPSLREVWGPAAVFVPPDDENALAAAINRLIDQPALRTQMAAAAQRRAAHFAPQRQALSYLNAYRAMIRHQDAVERGTTEPIAAHHWATEE